ncbi:hypothetical protein MSPP1_003617 [Malassezia sp. CBS 17886]|nr:hypothetical protein MSPP1_003617 [Malassezia sp. CBS 17886]
MPCTRLAARTACLPLPIRHLSTHAARPLPRAASRAPITQQVRTVRQSRFQRPVANPRDWMDVNAPGTSGASPGSGAAPSLAEGGWSRALLAFGIVAGTAIGANLFFNREKRGALGVFESSYLNSTFTYLGVGLAATAGSAYALHRSGVSSRIMFANPWLVLGAGLVVSIGSMIGAQALPPSSPFKVPCWLLFNVSNAAVLSPLFFLSPAILGRAALYTAGVVGSLCYVGATAKEEKYLFLGGPLLAGVTVVALSSLAPMVLPVTALRTLAATEAIALYGGLAVFGGFVLWDTQSILLHARQVEAGMRVADPLAESIGLELDVINIFTRIVQILAMRDQRKR